jgi:hypothetical protein
MTHHKKIMHSTQQKTYRQPTQNFIHKGRSRHSTWRHSKQLNEEIPLRLHTNNLIYYCLAATSKLYGPAATALLFKIDFYDGESNNAVPITIC